jgi:hypothetical protein
MGLDQNAGKLKHEYSYEFTNKEGEKSTHKWTNVMTEEMTSGFR